jgi:phosphatidylserine/phosphatidylglycerophosphate/cardiolipin synthase-like enzyme
MHLKVVICGNDDRMTAYVGGLDLVSNRVAGPMHPAGQLWHDLAVRVVGPAAGAVYNLYHDLWNEQIARPSKRFRVSNEVTKSHHRRGEFGDDAIASDGTPELPHRDCPPLEIPGDQHVQVLITLPQMNFVPNETETVPLDCKQRIALGFARDKLSFAPDGRFEFRAGLRKAIANAQKYIYVEDQALTAFEVMDWINQLLRATTGIKVILTWGADPADPPSPFTTESISNHLLPGVINPSNRVAFYARRGVVVHSKVVVIDDEWASVGTANFMRRSLYTDGEVAISVVDGETVAFARSLRKDLWGEACGLLPGTTSDVLLDLNDAFGIWDGNWGTPPAGLTLRPEYEKMKIPLEFAPVPGPGQFIGLAPPVFNQNSQIQYDVVDPDSRQVY